MASIIQGAGRSVLCWDEQKLVIQLSRQVLGKLWTALIERLTELWQAGSFFVWTQPAMTARGSGPDAPRWKSFPLDVWSGLMFMLKVSPKHELVRLWQVIDWTQINALAAQAYTNAHGGRYAWAPAQMIALLVLMFLYGVPHETTLLDRVKENIVWCWFCGLSLFGPWPDHSTIYTFRERMKRQDLFEQVLTLAVQACIEAGLVSNELVHFDLTEVIANGHRWSPYERAVVLSKALIRYLELVWADQAPQKPFPATLRTLAVEVALESLPHKTLEQVAPEQVVASMARWDAQAGPAQTDWQLTLEEAAQAQLSTTEAPFLKTFRLEQCKACLALAAKAILKRLPHTRGDQDARVGRTSNYSWFCGYLLGFVVDGWRHIITAVAWGAGNIDQPLLFRPAMEQHCQRVGKPKGVALDSAFDDPAVYAYLDAHSIAGHITSRQHTKPRDGGFGPDRVIWHPTQSWLCPQGAPLRIQGRKDRDRGRYIFGGTACGSCALYVQCYPKGEGQAKSFTFNPERHRRWLQNREHCRTEAYKVAQRARFVEEGRFGLAKMVHRAGRAPYRSEAMNRVAGLMIAAVMDWRLLARHRSPVLAKSA